MHKIIDFFITFTIKIYQIYNILLKMKLFSDQKFLKFATKFNFFSKSLGAEEFKFITNCHKVLTSSLTDFRKKLP